jgi:hypothetical protein
VVGVIARAHVDLTPDRPTTSAEFGQALTQVKRSKILEALDGVVPTRSGRSLSNLGLAVAFQVNGNRRGHKGELIAAARVLNSFTDDQLRVLGVTKWEPCQAYDRVERLFNAWRRSLEASPSVAGHRRDGHWMMNCLARAGVPRWARRQWKESRSLGVDGTAIPTWAVVQGRDAEIQLDGPASNDGADGSPRQQRRSKRTWPMGPDGRAVHTKDPSARGGWRTATGSTKAGKYVGYELHLATEARDVVWTNYVDKLTKGPEVPSFVWSAALVPAGTHRGTAVVDDLLNLKRTGTFDLEDVIWDPGYSYLDRTIVYFPLQEAGIHQTFTLHRNHRGTRTTALPANLIDGQLYSEHLPARLRGVPTAGSRELSPLPMPPHGTDEAGKLVYEEPFNERARWRFSRHAGPDSDGATRWRCPFCAGRLRSTAFKSSLSTSRSAPLVFVSTKAGACCSGTLRAEAADLPFWQRIPYGTTAWRLSVGRRSITESSNAAGKGDYVDWNDKGFIKVFGQTARQILLGFTIGGLNRYRARSFAAKHSGPAVVSTGVRRHQRRRKPRPGGWSSLRRATSPVANAPP